MGNNRCNKPCLKNLSLAFSANPTTPFVEFVYKVSGNYLDPFRGIFEARPVGETGYFDVASLFAVIIYLFIMWGFSALIHYVQNKIDINLHKQEKELRELKQQKLLEAQKAAAAANKPTARSRQV